MELRWSGLALPQRFLESSPSYYHIFYNVQCFYFDRDPMAFIISLTLEFFFGVKYEI